MKLTEKQVTRVRLNGRTYRINTAHTAVLAALQLFVRNDMNDADKFSCACKVLVKTPVWGMSVDDKALLLNEVLKVLFPDPPKESKLPVFDFEQDAEYIVAGFQQAYNINLMKTVLPWCEFLALMKGLPDSTRMSQIIELRAKPMPKPNKYNQEEIRALQKAKATVALKISEETRAQVFADSLKKAMRG